MLLLPQPLPLQLPHCGSNENTLKTVYVDGDFSLEEKKERRQQVQLVMPHNDCHNGLSCLPQAKRMPHAAEPFSIHCGTA